jgi:hypothetical protein
MGLVLAAVSQWAFVVVPVAGIRACMPHQDQLASIHGFVSSEFDGPCRVMT